MSPWALNRLVLALFRGAVIGYPTDTVWGLGCHPLIAASVARILQLKRRAPEKGLILLGSRLEHCLPFLSVSDTELTALRTPSEHPTTWLVPASPDCPAWIRGSHHSVAIRITDHPLLKILCDGLGAPLVSTSANLAGRSTARNALQLRRQLGGGLDAIVGGFEPGGNRPSEIRTLDGRIVRSRAQ